MNFAVIFSRKNNGQFLVLASSSAEDLSCILATGPLGIGLYSSSGLSEIPKTQYQAILIF